MSCPARDRLELHFEGAVEAAERESIRAHASTCEACGAVLRKLEEEAEALRRGLPDVAAPEGLERRVIPGRAPANPWKGMTALAAAIAIALAGALAFVVASQRAADAEARRRVEEQVRFHLAQNEPAKAAAAIAAFPGELAEARLEVAKASPAGDAAKLLDPVPLADKRLEVAFHIAQARVDAYEALFRLKVLENGAVPAPFDLEPYRRAKPSHAPREEMSRIVAGFSRALADRADVAKRSGRAVGAPAPLLPIARYALGEIPFREIGPVEGEARFALGDLLYRERQFDRAIETWRPMLDDARVVRRVAELAALRRLAPKALSVWDYDVEKLLGRDPKVEAEVAAAVEAMFRGAKPGTIEMLRPRDVIVEKAPPTEDPIYDVRHDREAKSDWITADPEQLYLLLDHHQFRLSLPTARPFTTRSGATLALRTAYGGDVRLRLLRARDIEAFRAIDERTLAAKRGELALVQEWEAPTAPLWENSLQDRAFTIAVPHRGPGLFVLIADARYCPVLAVAKFIVTDVALVQHVALDRVLIQAAERAEGAPVAGLAIAAEAVGRYELRPEDLLPSDDGNAAEFKRGFDAAWAGEKAELDATASYLAGFQRAAQIREANPEHRAEHRGVTDGDGLIEWSVPWKPGYRYDVRAVTVDPATYSRTETAYAPEARRQLRAVVYTDRPLYRPGDTVSFKALLRWHDNEGLHPYGERDAVVEFGTRGRTLVSKRVAATDLGTASGEFALPYDVEQGDYWARVNNAGERGVFKVEEYRKPEFEIVFAHPPAVRAGAPVDVAIAVRTYSGDPVAGAPLEVTLFAAPPAAAMLAPSAGDFAFPRERQQWREVEYRRLEAGADGRASFRFMTDEGVPARYWITVRATEMSQRQVVKSTTLEATGTAVDLGVETDRPVYAPGEIATLRIRAPGAAAARVEERKGEAPFAATVPLQSGLGTCAYRVPEEDRELHVGVRAGDDWAWLRVPVAVAKPEAAPGAMSVRADRAQYRVGETANVVVHGEPGQHVLVLTATGRVHERRLVRLESRERSIPIEIRESDVPNVGVKAVSVRGDALLTATAELRVPPVDRFLTVEVSTDKLEYRPGDECRATVRVLDARGRPVPEAELSLGVVDEAIYALHEDGTPDLREFFHRYRRSMTVAQGFFFSEAPGVFIVWKAPTFVKGTRNVIDIISGGGSGGGRYGGRLGGRQNLTSRGGGGADTALSPRSNFRDTAFWNAHLRTGADGTATVAFPFPENLTTFRFTARGLTRDHKVGEVRHRAVVRKPFYVRLATTRVLQEGNAVALAGLVHNATERPQTVRLSFKSDLPLVDSTAPEALTVAAGGVAKVEYLVSADRFRPVARFTFEARGEEVYDGVQIDVDGRRHGVPLHEGRSGSVAAGVPKEEVFRVPEGVIRGTLALRLNLDAGVHAAVIEGLEPLIRYPYGCVEQTMSRFLPAVAADQALGKQPHRWSQELPSVVASGLRRLYDFQHADGGWGWWKNDESNDVMTAYVLFGLAHCRRAGVGVDRAAMDRAAAFVRARLEKHLGRDPIG